MYQLIPILERLDACAPARRWIREARLQTAREVWAQIPNPEWLTWLLAVAISAARGWLIGLPRPVGRRQDLALLVAAEYRAQREWELLDYRFGPDPDTANAIRAVVTPEDLDALERVLVAFGRAKGALVKVRS